MRAAIVRSFGGPEQLELVELPDPDARSGEVLVSVAAASINRADVLARAGKYHRAGRPPLLLGLEAAGRIVAVGPEVATSAGSRLAVGQPVVAWGGTNDPGFYADLAAVPANQVLALPDGFDQTAAAALPTAWLSAWYCLRRLAQLRSGETVLIHAAASGVGSAAVQIAVDAGARVIATAGSALKTAWVKDLGAHEVLDTAALDGLSMIEAVLGLTGNRGADVVLDTVGGATFADSLKATAYAGRVICMANVALAPSTVDTRDFYPKNIRILGFQITGLMEHGYDPRGDLGELVAGVADGRFVVPVDSVFPLDLAVEAHQRLESREARGKVILSVERPA